MARSSVFRAFVYTFIASFSLTGARAADEPEVAGRFANGIAAIVEDRIITAADIHRRIDPLLPQIRAQSHNEAEFAKKLREYEDQTIQGLVDQYLIVKDFFSDEKRRFPSSMIDNALREKLITEFDNDRSKFQAFLKAIGKTEQEYRRTLMEDMIVDYMMQQKRKSTTIVSPVRIENYYTKNRDQFYQGDGVHLRLIKLSRLADENQAVLKQTADTIMERLRGGASFADLAKEYSQDSRRKQGGDWGWIARSDLREELAGPAFELDKGEYSEPIKVDNDIFILYVEEKRLAGIQPLEEVREQIERLLVSQMAREAQERWLERLRREAYVRYFN